MKKSFCISILIFLVFLNYSAFTQSQNSFIDSKLVVQSEDKDGKKFSAFMNNAVLTLNVTNGDFSVKADLSRLKTEDPKLDSVLNAQGNLFFIFKGNIDKNILKYNQEQNTEKEFEMPGTLTIGDNSIETVATYDPINLAEKSETKNYRMDFSVSVNPSKLSIKGLENKITKLLLFEIQGGKLNIQN